MDETNNIAELIAKRPVTERNILNMQETIERAKISGFSLSEYTLRRAIRAGNLPCRIIGRTYLIAWSNVIKWLLCEDSADNIKKISTSSLSSGIIRRVEL